MRMFDTNHKKLLSFCNFLKFTLKFLDYDNSFVYIHSKFVNEFLNGNHFSFVVTSSLDLVSYFHNNNIFPEIKFFKF